MSNQESFTIEGYEPHNASNSQDSLRHSVALHKRRPSGTVPPLFDFPSNSMIHFDFLVAALPFKSYSLHMIIYLALITYIYLCQNKLLKLFFYIYKKKYASSIVFHIMTQLLHVYELSLCPIDQLLFFGLYPPTSILCYKI